MKLNPQIILLEKFEQFFIEEGNKVISTHPACQSCGKSVSPNQMKIFRFEYIPMNATRQMLKQLSHRQKLRMLVKKGNTFSLNHKDMFVVRIKNEYKNAKSQVLCISCFHAARHQFEWNILIDPSSSDKQLKEMIRNLIKKGANHEILEFCELMDPHISNRMRKIPRHVRHIWLLFSFFAKKLVLHPKAKPYVMQWMEKWLELLSENNFIASQIGTSIAKSIYAIDDEALCLAFFPILYQSDLNLFKFFRMNSEIHPNHSIILYLLQVQNDALFSDGQMDNSLQGLIAGCNTAQIKLLLENFDQFKESAQRILMEDLFFFGYRKNCADGLILLKAKINELPNPDLKAQFLTYFSELKTELVTPKHSAPTR